MIQNKNPNKGNWKLLAWKWCRGAFRPIQNKNPNKGNWKHYLRFKAFPSTFYRYRTKIPIKGIESLIVVSLLLVRSARYRTKIPIKGIERYFVLIPLPLLYSLWYRTKIPIKGIERHNSFMLARLLYSRIQNKNPNKGNWKFYAMLPPFMFFHVDTEQKSQ